jgi:hypothetical protein
MRLIAFALLLAFASPCFAQNRDGNWWNELSATQRSYTLVGFMEGMDLGKNFTEWGGLQSGKAAPWVGTAEASYVEYFNKYVAEVSMGQMSDGLNEFYKDFRNRSISVSDALWIVLKQIAGTPQAEVDALIEAHRKNVRPKP